MVNLERGSCDSLSLRPDGHLRWEDGFWILDVGYLPMLWIDVGLSLDFDRAHQAILFEERFP